MVESSRNERSDAPRDSPGQYVVVGICGLFAMTLASHLLILRNSLGEDEWVTLHDVDVETFSWDGLKRDSPVQHSGGVGSGLETDHQVDNRAKQDVTQCEKCCVRQQVALSDGDTSPVPAGKVELRSPVPLHPPPEFPKQNGKPPHDRTQITASIDRNKHPNGPDHCFLVDNWKTTARFALMNIVHMWHTWHTVKFTTASTLIGYGDPTMHLSNLQTVMAPMSSRGLDVRHLSVTEQLCCSRITVGYHLMPGTGNESNSAWLPSDPWGAEGSSSRLNSHLWMKAMGETVLAAFKPPHRHELTGPFRALLVIRDMASADGRSVHNLKQLAQKLKSRGVDVVIRRFDFEGSWGKIASEMEEVDLLIGSHGVGLSSMMFARPGLRVVELHTCGWSSFVYRRLSLALGHVYMSYVPRAYECLASDAWNREIEAFSREHPDVPVDTTEERTSVWNDIEPARLESMKIARYKDLQPDVERLDQFMATSGAFLMRDHQDIWLVRVLGNDLPPIHGRGQHLVNLRYTLEYETASLKRCRKVFIINRVWDQEERRKMIKMLLDHGIDDEDIVDRPIVWNDLPAGEAAWPSYMLDVNGARNMGIDMAREGGGSWVLPYDGNIFMTDQAWADVLAVVSDHTYQPTSVVENPFDCEQDRLGYGPMYFMQDTIRLHKEQRPEWFGADTEIDRIIGQGVGAKAGKMRHEAQIGIRVDSPERFHTDKTWPNNDKHEMLTRVCGVATAATGRQALHGCVQTENPIPRMYTFPPGERGERAITSAAEWAMALRYEGVKALVKTMRKTASSVKLNLSGSDKTRCGNEGKCSDLSRVECPVKCGCDWQRTKCVYAKVTGPKEK